MGDRLGIQVAVDILPSFLTPDAKMNTSWYPCRNASSCVSTQLSFDTWTFLYDLYLHFIDKLTGCCCIGWLEQYGHLAGWVARAWFLLQLPTPPLAPGIWCPPYVPTTPAMGASSPSLQGSPLPPSCWIYESRARGPRGQQSRILALGNPAPRTNLAHCKAAFSLDYFIR